MAVLKSGVTDAFRPVWWRPASQPAIFMVGRDAHSHCIGISVAPSRSRTSVRVRHFQP